MKKKLNIYVIFIAILSIIISTFVIPNSFVQDTLKIDINYKLWLDLQWWIELDYYVDLTEAKKKDNYDELATIEWLKSIIEKRVQTLNINDSTITSTNYAWERHILVQIPMKWSNDKEIQRNIEIAKEAIWKVVKIEFKEKRTSITEEDLAERKQLADEILVELKAKPNQFDSISRMYRDWYENITYWTFSWTEKELSDLFVLNYSDLKTWIVDDLIEWTWAYDIVAYENWTYWYEWQEWFYILNYSWSQDNPDYVPNTSEITDNSNNSENSQNQEQTSDAENTENTENNSGTENLVEENWTESDESKSNEDEKYIYTFNYIFVTKSPSERIWAADSKWRILNDLYFENASVDNQNFVPKVELHFNAEWAKIFKELTTRLKWEQIAIFVWWEMLTDPVVNDVIANWNAVITWNYTMEEAKELAQSINAWVVPAPIYLTSENAIDSKLWDNSLNLLLLSWLIWFVLIFWFLIFTYRLTWLMAAIALIIYTILIAFIVKFLWIVMTLASIAWIILSIWMAIDSNILIFERTKELLKDWKNIKTSFSEWFVNSFSAIFDSNITWIITSFILYIFWVNMIKWFWLMFWIWLILSLFTVLYVSRILIFWVVNLDIKEKFLIWKVKKN